MTVRLTATIGFVGDEELTFDLVAPEGECSACHRELHDDKRLSLTLAANGDEFDVRICRACISEHAPALLAEIER